MNMNVFNSLPANIKEQVKDTLRAYSSVHITFSNGEYHVSTGICLMSKYPDDHRVIGDIAASDIYTPDEQIVNYIETFLAYPIQYEGFRDYDLIFRLKACRAKGENYRIHLEGGTAKIDLLS